MKIEDLVQLLSNRLREFKLSRDYAKMSGDLERMNAADKEIIGLEDTLYQLSLLVDVSKSTAAKETTLTEALTDGSVSVLGEYDITSYATDPLHERKVMTILSNMGVMDTVEKIDDYIDTKYWSSPVTGDMIMSAALAYDVDQRLMMAIMEQDSRFGTVGLAVSTLNPGNVGNDDDGNTRTYASWQEGVTAVAEWLSRHRGSTEIPLETVFEPTSTSTPVTTAPTASSTPATATSTTATTTPTATSTPQTTTPTASSTPVTTAPTASSTPPTASSTPVTATSTPATATTTPSTNSGQATSTPTTSTTTPTTTTSTTTPTTSSSTSSGQATTTPTTASSTPVTSTSTTTPATVN